MRPRITTSDAAATSEPDSAAAPINSAVPRYLLALIVIGVTALLGAGCQGGEAAVQDHGETTVEETSERSHEAKQTLGLITGMLADIQEMLSKIAARQEDYASTGDAQGEQAMREAAETVEDMEEAAQDIAGATQARSGRTTPSPQQVNSYAALLRAKNEELEEILNEAKYCCGLESDFLSEDLQELRAQTNSLESLGQQREAEQTVPEGAGPEQTGQEKAAPQQLESPPKKETPSKEKAAPPPPPTEEAVPLAPPEPPPPPEEEIPLKEEALLPPLKPPLPLPEPPPPLARAQVGTGG